MVDILVILDNAQFICLYFDNTFVVHAKLRSLTAALSDFFWLRDGPRKVTFKTIQVSHKLDIIITSIKCFFNNVSFFSGTYTKNI